MEMASARYSMGPRVSQPLFRLKPYAASATISITGSRTSSSITCTCNVTNCCCSSFFKWNESFINNMKSARCLESQSDYNTWLGIVNYTFRCAMTDQVNPPGSSVAPKIDWSLVFGFPDNVVPSTGANPDDIWLDILFWWWYKKRWCKMHLCQTYLYWCLDLAVSPLEM